MHTVTNDDTCVIPVYLLCNIYNKDRMENININIKNYL